MRNNLGFCLSQYSITIMNLLYFCLLLMKLDYNIDKFIIGIGAKRIAFLKELQKNGNELKLQIGSD